MTQIAFFEGALTRKISGFLNEIGIETIPAKFDAPTFLPGILVKDGRLLVDEQKLTFPGDLLHEAGHLAVAPAEIRRRLSDEVVILDFDPDELEARAIAWSYAACVHLQIEPRVVFHEHGYKGKSESLLFSFELGVFIGLNGLEDSGMAFSARRAHEIDAAPFPAMQKWLND